MEPGCGIMSFILIDLEHEIRLESGPNFEFLS